MNECYILLRNVVINVTFNHTKSRYLINTNNYLDILYVICFFKFARTKCNEDIYFKKCKQTRHPNGFACILEIV